jgi:glycosyltransferase involved in cell wall biosynthesis
MNKVSVVIPSYNHSKYIRAAVESVLSQSYDNLELIVVDDGSSDDSLEYLRSITDDRLLLIEQENAGAHNAINRGLDLASGDYLTILNSDDTYSPTRLSECIAALENGKGDLVTTWIEVVDADSKVLGIKQGWRNMLPWQIPDQAHSYAASNSFNLNLLVSNFVSTTSNILFTRKLYASIGGMRNLRFAHDWDFMFRCAEKFKCILLEKPLMQYRVHGSNTISSNRAWMLFEICWVFATGLKRYEVNELFSDTSNQSLPDCVYKLANSINLQGNDKVFWLIKQFIASMEAKGVVDPELMLLDDVELRNAFIKYIVTAEPEAVDKPSLIVDQIKFDDVVLYAKRRIKRFFAIN